MPAEQHEQERQRFLTWFDTQLGAWWTSNDPVEMARVREAAWAGWLERAQ